MTDTPDIYLDSTYTVSARIDEMANDIKTKFSDDLKTNCLQVDETTLRYKMVWQFLRRLSIF